MTKIMRLAGTSQPDIQQNVNTYGGPGVGNYQLVREPENIHDQNAIKVALAGHWVIGYIPAPIAVELAPQMDGGRIFEAEFVQLNRAPGHDTVGITVRIVEVA